MNKFVRHCFVAASAIALMGGLSACSMDNDEISESYEMKLCNLVIPSDPSQEVYVQTGSLYKMNFLLNKGTVEVSGADVQLGTPKYTFNVAGISYENAMNQQGFVRRFAGASGTLAGTSYEIKNLSGFLSTLVNWYNLPIPGFVSVQTTSTMAVSYQVGDDYTIKTFPADMFFTGSQTTTYSFMGAPEKKFDYADAIYRVRFSDDMKSATVIIMNVTFAEEMPKIIEAIVLKDLAVSYDATGYHISGSNILPEMLEAGALTPMPQYTFNDFSLDSDGPLLTECKCAYTVAGTFHGVFSGSYVQY